MAVKLGLPVMYKLVVSSKSWPYKIQSDEADFLSD